MPHQLRHIQINTLQDRPGYLQVLADWHHAEWSYLNPDRTLAMRIEQMRADLEGRVIPTTFVAECEGELLGSASLLAADMSSHPELTPWLGSVYVADRHRRKGIGSMLVRRVVQHAWDNGIRQLYLYTPDQAQLYARLGWQVCSEESYNGTPVTLMTIRC